MDGVAIETTDTTVFAIEGEAEIIGDQSTIQLGMIVRAFSTEEDDGTLIGERFEVDDGILGVVESVSPNADNPSIGTVFVAGQAIIVTSNTIFDDDIPDLDGIDGTDLRDLDPTLSAGGAGLVIEVSGFATEFGALASRIELVDGLSAASIGTPGVDGDEVQVVGFVDSVTPAGDSFTINGATFAVNGATELDDGIAIDGNLVGRFVEVEADIDVSGTLIAVEVENEGDFDDLSDDFDVDLDDFDIEGLLQLVDLDQTPNLIVINGIGFRVADASGLTEFVGQIVDIEGDVDANGVLQITEIETNQENTLETEDLIASVDPTNGVVITRLGVSIEPTTASRLDVDDDISPNDALTPDEFLAVVSPGDLIKASGFPGMNGPVWTRIEVQDESSDVPCRLQGPVEPGSISDPFFSILGTVIDTTGLNESGFEFEAEDIDTGREAFFNELADGNIVIATSEDDGTGCTPGQLETFENGEVELEEDDTDGADGISTLEIEGAVAEVDAVNNTFSINGFTVLVTDETLIGADIIAAAQQGSADATSPTVFGNLNETLDVLLPEGTEIEVTIDATSQALEIELDD
ncbi:MAG: DUF5666 domain-containing protein [Pseudomonadota bacterium]